MSTSAPPCPVCSSRDSVVKDSRPSGKTIRRRRTCACGHRFTTHEITSEEIAVMRAWRTDALAHSSLLKRIAEFAESEDAL